MYITLDEWNEKNFSQAHSIRTLRAWAKSGQIQPEPVKVGRRLMVEETARFVPLSAHTDSLQSKLLADPLVSEIFFNGTQSA